MDAVRAHAMMLCGLLLLAFLGGARAASLAPGDTAVFLSGVAGRQSESHAIRVEMAPGEKPPELVFTPSDLLRTTPPLSRIDRSQLQITPVPGAAGLYAIAVTALPERYGSYTGTIRVADSAGTSYPPIEATLLVQLAPTQAFNSSPASVVLQLAKGGIRLLKVVSDWPSASSALVVIPRLPAGVWVASVQLHPLMSARGFGEFPGHYGVIKQARGVMIHADSSTARPDRYTSIAELELVGSEQRIAIPVEVEVRASPLVVLALLSLGIALGRAAKWMNEQGHKLLTAQRSVDDLALRAAGFEPDYRRHLDDRLGSLRRLLQNRLAGFDALLADALARAELLERAGALRRLAVAKGDAVARTTLDDIALAVQSVTRPAPLQSSLDAVESALLALPAADGMAHDALGAETAAVAHERANPMRWISAARTGLGLVGTALLALVGYQVIYLNGAPTFGANVADYFGALVWGLSADVAARGITSLGWTAPR